SEKRQINVRKAFRRLRVPEFIRSLIRATAQLGRVCTQYIPYLECQILRVPPLGNEAGSKIAQDGGHAGERIGDWNDTAAHRLDDGAMAFVGAGGGEE